MKLIKIVLQIVLLVVAFLLGTKYESIKNATKNTTTPAAISSDAIIVDEEEATIQDNSSEIEMEISDTEVLETMDSDVPTLPAEDVMIPNADTTVEATNVETVESSLDDTSAINDVNVGVESGSVAPTASVEASQAQ